MDGVVYQVLQGLLALLLVAGAATLLLWVIRPVPPPQSNPSGTSSGVVDHNVIEAARRSRDFRILGPVTRKGHRWTRS